MNIIFLSSGFSTFISVVFLLIVCAPILYYLFIIVCAIAKIIFEILKAIWPLVLMIFIVTVIVLIGQCSDREKAKERKRKGYRTSYIIEDTKAEIMDISETYTSIV